MDPTTITTTTTAAAVVAQTISASGGLADSTIIAVLLSVLSALLLYSFHQIWEKKKLKIVLVVADDIAIGSILWYARLCTHPVAFQKV